MHLGGFEAQRFGVEAPLRWQVEVLCKSDDGLAVELLGVEAVESRGRRGRGGLGWM